MSSAEQESTSTEAFAERLFPLAARNGISQADIARLLGAKQSSVNSWFRAQNRPSIEQVVRLADLLDTSVEFLLVGQTKPDAFDGDSLLPVLQRIESRIIDLIDDVREAKARIGFLEKQYACLSNRIDRIDDRLARVGKRLDPTDA